MWWGFAIHSAQWTIHPLPSQIIPVAECYDIKGVGPLRVASLYNYSWLHAKRMLSPLCVWQVNATGLCASEMTVRIEIRNSERCRGFAATRCRKFLQQFLGTLAKLRKENFSFVMSVCLSVSLTDCSSVCVSVRMVKSATTEEIFIKLDVWVFFENLSRKFKFRENLTRITLIYIRPTYSYDCISLNSSQNEKCFRQSCRKNQNIHFMFKTFSWKSCRLWHNVEKFCIGRKTKCDSIIRRMRVACWITKGTNALKICSTYCFPQQQYLRERA